MNVFSCCLKLFKNKKSYTNHTRWHNQEFNNRIRQTLKGINSGNKNGMWRGDDVGYHALHSYVKSKLLKPRKCSSCNKETSSLDLANISHKYKRDLSDWEWLCRKCHMFKDGRLNIFIINRYKTSKRGKDGRYMR